MITVATRSALRSPSAQAPSPPLRPDTQARILEAAFDSVAAFGLTRLTMDEVARRTGVSRQTVYRYFPSKDQLVMALVLREEEAFLDGVRAAFAADDRLERALFDGILFCLRYARQHPLLDKLLATDAETLLPYLTTRAGPMMARAREVLKSLAASKAWVRAGLVDQVGDTLVRVILSYALSPPDRPAEDVARDLARIVTVALTGKEEPRT
jgi:AcrR family transcriptional regulator